MRKQLVSWIGLYAVCATVSLSCGHVTLGNFNPAPTFPQEWEYRAGNDPDTGGFRLGSRSTLSAAQAGLYRQLQSDLSDTLAMHRQLGTQGYRHAWPILDAQRIEQLQPRYDYADQLLTWNYENLGDYDLDSMVNTSDLLPVVVYAGFDGGRVLSNGVEADTIRRWIDSDFDGQLGRFNAQIIGQGYGRVITGYAVSAGQVDKLELMDPIGIVRYVDRLPGIPPRFELHIPSGYQYACIQALGPRQTVVCSYVLSLVNQQLPVTVTHPDPLTGSIR